MREKIAAQELTSQEITSVIIERIKAINPKVNAICTPSFEMAMEMAEKADNAVKIGGKLGLLHGIPMTFKDETETKGIRTTFGCKVYENHVPTKDEVEVQRAKNEGCVLLGKTNTPAFGARVVTDNLIFGASKNPWNLAKTTGGSSGGAAAANASGMGPIAIGSDAGGSIRMPSSFCGVYGLKPSFGRIPHGVMNVFGELGTFVHKGPIVRYVEDAALLLDALSGIHHSDRYSLPKPTFSFLDKLNELPSKLRIGFSSNFGLIKAIDPGVIQVVQAALTNFESYGWTVEEVKVNLKVARKAAWTLIISGYAYVFKPLYEQSPEMLDQIILDNIETGLNFSVQDIKLAGIQREMVGKEVCRHLKEYDVLITPTMPCTAFDLGIDAPKEINGKPIGPDLLDILPFTYPFNLTGHPAASIPCGWSSNGLPIGMQIVGKRQDELTVLQVSKAYENIAPWQDKRPPL